MKPNNSSSKTLRGASAYVRKCLLTCVFEYYACDHFSKCQFCHEKHRRLLYLSVWSDHVPFNESIVYAIVFNPVAPLTSRYLWFGNKMHIVIYIMSQLSYGITWRWKWKRIIPFITFSEGIFIKMSSPPLPNWRGLSDAGASPGTWPWKWIMWLWPVILRDILNSNIFPYFSTQLKYLVSLHLMRHK